MITITVNGKREDLDKEMPVGEMLRSRNIRPEVVTVELNDNILKREEFGRQIIKDGDRLEFVYFMGGGSAHFVRSPFLSRTILSV
ncbi:MAG: sulfur carrier protein ThiS [Candidatus Omnitrophota bacterium]